MKKVVLVMFLSIFLTEVAAQTKMIQGILKDADTQEALMQATVQLLNADSIFVGGSISDEQGVFLLSVPSAGKYLLKITSVGYTTQYKAVNVSRQDSLNVGTIVLKSDAVMLKGAIITRNAAKVTLKADTFIYNATAYKAPEGSAIEELVKRLPGAVVSDDGKITINGKEVTKILIDGKEFMTGDTKTAMKNLPASIIEKIKTYEEKSDFAKATGVDDGEEQTVLDFGIKQGMNKGVFGNADVAAGTKSRYAERLMGALFKDDLKLMGFANFNNTNDMGFSPGGGRGGFGQSNN